MSAKYLDYSGLKKVIDWAKGNFVNFEDATIPLSKYGDPADIDSRKGIGLLGWIRFFNGRNQIYIGRQASGSGFTIIDEDNGGYEFVNHGIKNRTSTYQSNTKVYSTDGGIYDLNQKLDANSKITENDINSLFNS